jgi:hypothetical protein
MNAVIRPSAQHLLIQFLRTLRNLHEPCAMGVSEGLLLVALIYASAAYLLGIPLPPHPYPTLAWLLIIQAILSIYNEAPVRLLTKLSGSASQPHRQGTSLAHLTDLEKTRWAFLSAVAVGTALLAQAVIFSEDGQWRVPGTEAALGFATAIAVSEFGLLFILLLGKP